MKPNCSLNRNALGKWAVIVFVICPGFCLSASTSGLRGGNPSPQSSLLKSKVHGPWTAYYDEENPFQKDMHIARITDNLDPAAPASDFSDSVTKFSDNNASPFSGLRNIPADMHPNAFPEPYPAQFGFSKYNSSDPHWKRLKTSMACKKSPNHWVDKIGYSCAHYGKAEWCDETKKLGRGWDKSWGTFDDFARHGVSAWQACCECGGGVNDVVVGQPAVPIEKRELFAPGDGLALKYTPLMDPESYYRPYPATAAADTVPKTVSRYFDWEYKKSSEPDIPGLSGEFYVYPPPRLNAGESAYVSSRIFRGLDFSGKYQNYYQDLEWPAPFEDEPPVWWVRWTGSLRIMKEGKYKFDVDIGWDTTSKLFVDGHKLLTSGQCKATKTPGKCENKGCTWCATKLSCGTHEDVCPPPPPEAPAPGPASSPANSPGPAPSAAAPAAATAPAPAGPAGPAPPPLPSSLNLPEGGHCVEIVVKVEKSRGTPTLKWKYSGPDTLGRLQIVPANSLFCRPSIPACVRPAIDSCAKVKSEDDL